MQIKKIINGHEYIFEVTQNWIAAGEICKEINAGYKLTHETDGYISKIYKTNTSFFETNVKKLIGTLISTPNNQMILYKFVKMDEHHFIKGDSFGINHSIMKHLRTFDRILIETDKKKKYSISVEKALKVGEYLHFDSYELQNFIPVNEFKEVVKKKKTSQKRK